MRKLRLALVASILVSAGMFTSAPAEASTCGLPKAACTAYYKACQVASLAGLQCVD